MSNTQITSLNELLRGELAATETYQQALSKEADEPWAEQLRAIHAEHRAAAYLLRQQVRDCGGIPSPSSGAWGAFAKAVEGTAKLLGNKAALKALKAGEEYGVRAYEAALNEDLPAESRSFITTTLLPQTEAHIPILDSLMQGR